jgi:two-component sensor histidine kinase/sensor domain CHASE-containing protein
MTIRHKTLLIIGATLLALLAVIYGLSAWILTANLKVVERQATRENVNRVRDALTQKLAAMNTTTNSWSQWTATGDFIGNKNPKYRAENLTPSTITTMKSDVIMLLDVRGRIVFGINHDLKAVKNLPLDPQVRTYLTPRSPLLRHASPSSVHLGILPTSPSTLLFVTRPVVNDTGGGPVRGTLMTGVYLTPAEVENLSQLTHLGVDLQSMGGEMPSDFERARPHLENPQTIWINPVSADVVAGYTLLSDVFNRPALLMRVQARRDIWKQGQLGIRNVVLALLLSGLIFGLVTLLLLERLVLSRMMWLSHEVGAISKAGNFSQLVSVTGRDELSGLSNNINDMIRALQTSLLNEENNRHEIESSLREKDVLLKELYHRVKNNLQVVSSLLSLQMDGITDPDVCEMFDESRNRVRSMALVHEKLYQSSDLGRIDFGEYLDNLAHSLVRSYSNRGGQIALEMDCDAAQLNLDLAVPCGLIVNELVTNSLKYGFPNGRRGKILIALKSDDSGEIRLEVSDDGIGIPADFDIHEAQSIGMQLVTGLTEQLEGHFELDRRQGTRWTIFFKGNND